MKTDLEGVEKVNPAQQPRHVVQARPRTYERHGSEVGESAAAGRAGFSGFSCAPLSARQRSAAGDISGVELNCAGIFKLQQSHQPRRLRTGSALIQMWRFIARPLDRCAIRSACGSVLPSPDGRPHADEAAAMLSRDDFFAPPVAPAELRFTNETSFEFQSAVRSNSATNDVVRGRCKFAARGWREHPSVILLHGWNAARQYEWQFPHWSRLLARAGLNAFRIELPHHMSRTPVEAGVIRNFLSGDLLHVVRTMHQALADVRALALWLRAQGSPAVALWGVSLGGWLSGLAAAHQPEIETAALVTPVVRMDRALKELAFFDPIRASLAGLEQQFYPLNLVAHSPPRAKTLIVASRLDLFAPIETIDELQRSWRPEVWRPTHGHLSVLLSSRIIRRTVKWLAANTPRAAFDAVAGAP